VSRMIEVRVGLAAEAMLASRAGYRSFGQ